MIVSPIFAEVPDEIGETWTGSFLVGGMASAPNDMEIARAYIESAERLIDSAANDREPWRVAYPILFLYRHALELLLKAVVKPSKLTHELKPLVQALDDLLTQRFGQRLPQSLQADLLMFSHIDNDSQGFRYARARSGARRFLEGEYWVQLDMLKQRMRLLHDGLQKMHAAL